MDTNWESAIEVDIPTKYDEKWCWFSKRTFHNLINQNYYLQFKVFIISYYGYQKLEAEGWYEITFIRNNLISNGAIPYHV